MTVRVVVSDTSPLRALAQLELLHIPGAIFEAVYVPPAVLDELRVPVAGLPPFDVGLLTGARVQAPLDRDRVRQLGARLGKGEAEALSLAIEVGAKAVLLDDLAARALAHELGLEPLGVLGLWVRAKTSGLVGHVRPLIDRLEAELGFRVSDSLRLRVLSAAGE